ncbi:LPXTG cell wall anchor domain-containing protein [Vagococcus salmoninarum]
MPQTGETLNKSTSLLGMMVLGLGMVGFKQRYRPRHSKKK